MWWWREVKGSHREQHCCAAVQPGFQAVPSQLRQLPWPERGKVTGLQKDSEDYVLR